MLLTSTDGASVELRPTRYEYPIAPLVPSEDEGWDANWLQIAGAVSAASGQGWRFEDPCLTTWEAQDLGRWLRAAAQDEIAVTLAPDRDPVGVLEFTEPELAFSIASREGEHLAVRIHLAQLATPAQPWPTAPGLDRSRGGANVLTLTLSTTSTDLLNAADAWRDDLAPFPRRPSNHREDDDRGGERQQRDKARGAGADRGG